MPQLVTKAALAPHAGIVVAVLNALIPAAAQDRVGAAGEARGVLLLRAACSCRSSTRCTAISDVYTSVVTSFGVCAACGFSELYARDFDKLAELADRPDANVTLLEAGPEHPYR